MKKPPNILKRKYNNFKVCAHIKTPIFEAMNKIADNLMSDGSNMGMVLV